MKQEHISSAAVIIMMAIIWVYILTRLDRSPEMEEYIVSPDDSVYFWEDQWDTCLVAVNDTLTIIAPLNKQKCYYKMLGK